MSTRRPDAARRLLLKSTLLPLLATAPHLRARAASAAFAADDLAHARLLRERALQSPLAFRLVDSLVREVGPRPAGSPADALAVEWALARLRGLGFADVRAEPVRLRAWRRGTASVHLVDTAPAPEALVAVALGNSVGTAPDGIEGEVAYFPDFAALRSETGDRARGRIVFIDQQTARTRDGSGYGQAVPARFLGAVEAARRGATALVIRSIGTSRERIAHTGTMRYEPGVPAIPAVAVSNQDADRVRDIHASGRAPRLRLRVQPLGHADATSHNVIADVPGTDLAGEVVLLGAHLDTWDTAPGALDDGAGVGIVTAAAHMLLDAGRRPRRTVRVVLFANEENGLDGAQAYAQRYRDVAHQLVGESDFGADRIWRMRTRVRAEARAVVHAIAEELRPLGIAADDEPAAPSPDAAVLARARGWPAIELTQDGTRYFDVHHTPHDTMDRIDPATLPQNVAAWAVVAWLAAQSGVTFGPVATARG